MKLTSRFAVQTAANALIIGGISILALTLWPMASSEAWYWGKTLERAIKCKIYQIDCEKNPDSLFAPLANSPTPLKVEPVSQTFGLIIEKIGINAPVIENVSTTNKTLYLKAMRDGVAHAKGTAKPGEAGNSYLFAHSSLNFWQLGKYATVFNLLRKLEPEDKIVVLYQGKRFDYRVMKREIVSGFDTEPLLREVSEPVLTLQTCHPPGTTLNRLVVTATLTENRSQ